ncbi:MAG TPA: cytochrome c [Pirellulales bacterium]|jgi:mono/diheme cytochrome c family protein
MTGPRQSPKTIIALALGAIMAVGCQQKMADQPSFRPDQPVGFFPGGTSSRQPVPGTVARGHLETDLALFTGKRTAEPLPILTDAKAPTQPPPGDAQTLLAAELANYQNVVEEFPIPIDESVVEHGYHRYMIYCVVCHDAVGGGQGKIVERGYTRPPSYHIQRLRDAPVGHFFRVITEGYGSMPSYAAQIPAPDRWAIVAYIRALQLSQHCPIDESPEKVSSLDSSHPWSMTAEKSP